MQGMIDVHSHILPNVDDGAKNMEMTREMLRTAWSEGIRAIIATPHHRKGYARTPASKLREVYQAVCLEAWKIHPDFRIYLGSEVFRSHDMTEKLERQEALTMAGTNYVLAEFLPSTPYGEIQAVLRRLQMSGYRPVVAHAERYTCLVKEPELVEELTDMGCCIQVNSASVTGENGFSTKRFVKKLMKYELVHFLGTDAHDMGSRRPAMKKCAAYIEKKFGSEYAENVCWNNAVRMLQNQSIYTK